MKVGSLFTGVGGFDLGFQQAGCSVSWSCELDKFANRVLDERFPEVPNFKDVKDVYTKITPEEVDLICGGFPCQDVSISGNRKGLAGERSGLWGEFSRIIEKSRPRWVVIENVPGLLSSNKGRDFATIVLQLEKYGYGWTSRVLDSQYFGVPQRRRRLFIVASLGTGRSAEVLLERESYPGNSKTRPQVWDNNTRVVSTLSASGAGLSRAAGQRNELGFLIPVVPTSVYQSHSSVILESPTAYCLAATSVKSGRSGLVRDSEKHLRRLTPLEAERLQGFPDGWTDVGISDTQRYKQMGNAVTVPVIKWIAQRILKADK